MTKKMVALLINRQRATTNRYPKRTLAPINYNDNYNFREQKRILQNIYPHLRTKKWTNDFIHYHKFYSNLKVPFPNKIADKEWKRTGITPQNINYSCCAGIWNKETSDISTNSNVHEPLLKDKTQVHTLYIRNYKLHYLFCKISATIPYYFE